MKRKSKSTNLIACVIQLSVVLILIILTGISNCQRIQQYDVLRGSSGTKTTLDPARNSETRKDSDIHIHKLEDDVYVYEYPQFQSLSLSSHHDNNIKRRIKSESRFSTHTDTHIRTRILEEDNENEKKTNQSPNNNPTPQTKPNPHPIKLLKRDLIYSTKRNTVPIVNEEFKTIFFQMAKVASSQWTRFFLRLEDNPLWCSKDFIRYGHNIKANGLTYLSNYTLSEAEAMMNSPEWTKVTFVRHPKPRLLSAFLDKAVEHSGYFQQNTCNVMARAKVKVKVKVNTRESHECECDDGDGDSQGDCDQKLKQKYLKECINKHEDFEYFITNVTRTLPLNVHWRSIYSQIDEKWWPSISFIGNMDNLADDTETYLRSIRSNRDNATAWERLGSTGWGRGDGDLNNCIPGKSAFLELQERGNINNAEGQSQGQGKSAVLRAHQTNARRKMLKYYNPSLEKFVEVHYADDLNNHFFRFESVQLFGSGTDTYIETDTDTDTEYTDLRSSNTRDSE